ncbi:hypothetical protein NL676_026335 [Syzygium grande]|nr:hypothetical protein NL676_026335 [Syzygium grande]
MLRTMRMKRRSNSDYVTAAAIVIVLVLVVHVMGLSESEGQQQQNLRVGFYSESCPSAESIVHAVVKEAVLSVPRNAPLLLRIHFHDCFVEGCDGSILIDNGNSSERCTVAHAGVGGFEIIEAAKARLESTCPGSSLAPILWLWLLEMLFTCCAYHWNDRMLLHDHVTLPIQFHRRVGPRDQPSVPSGSQVQMPPRWGHHREVRRDINSDARLYDNRHTRQMVDLYTQNNSSNKHEKPPSFKADFAASMVKMGQIGIKMGSQGEIRRVCSSFN